MPRRRCLLPLLLWRPMAQNRRRLIVNHPKHSEIFTMSLKSWSLVLKLRRQQNLIRRTSITIGSRLSIACSTSPMITLPLAIPPTTTSLPKSRSSTTESISTRPASVEDAYLLTGSLSIGPPKWTTWVILSRLRIHTRPAEKQIPWSTSSDIITR